MAAYVLPAPSERATQLHERMVAFMRDRVLPAESEYVAARRAAELVVGAPYANPAPVTYDGVRRLLDDAYHGRRP